YARRARVSARSYWACSRATSARSCSTTGSSGTMSRAWLSASAAASTWPAARAAVARSRRSATCGSRSGRTSSSVSAAPAAAWTAARRWAGVTSGAAEAGRWGAVPHAASSRHGSSAARERGEAFMPPLWPRRLRRGRLFLLLRLRGLAAATEQATPEAGLVLRRSGVFAGRIRKVGRAAGCVIGHRAGHERETAGAGAVGIGDVGAFGLHPLPVHALGVHPQRRARQAREQPRPHPHRAGGAVQPGLLVLAVADPDHGQVVAGVAGEPAVAAIVAGAGLAGRGQPAEAVAVQLARRALVDHFLQPDGDQLGGDRIAPLGRRRRGVVALEQLALRIEHA